MLDPSNTNRDVYADEAYVDGEREASLTEQGWRTHIQRKGTKDKAISETQEQRNKHIATTRAQGRMQRKVRLALHSSEVHSLFLRVQ